MCLALHFAEMRVGDSVYCTLLFTIWHQHRMVKSRGQYWEIRLFCVPALWRSVIYEIIYASSFLSIGVLSSIAWMQLDTEALCQLLIYSGIPALGTEKINITLVLFPAVQRIHASSLQTRSLFSYASIAPPLHQTQHTRKRGQYFEWDPQILTENKSDVSLKKHLCKVLYWYFPEETPPF